MTSSYYEELFAGSNQKRNKYEWFTKQFATPLAAFGTVEHNFHRMRRSAMNPFFSKASVRRLQPVIQEKINKLMSRINGFGESGEVLNIHLAYMANSSGMPDSHVDSALLTMSQDVIAEYSFGRNYGRLDQEDFDPDYARAMHDATGASHFNKQIFWPFATLLALPPWVGTKIAPGLSGYVSFINDCAIQVKAIKEGTNEKSQTTIFHHLIESKDIPDSEKVNDRLIQEAQIVVSAGTETTAWAMSVLTFHLLSNPEILGKLRKELERAITDPSELPSLASLEQLPYLTACIQETLRFSYGLASRLQRTSPEKPMVFNDGKKDWVIPPGVSQSRCTA
jgi:cytochrome P450